MRIDAYASLPHYAAHIAPVWDALPDRLRGTFYGKAAADPWADVQLSRRDKPTGPLIVASGVDARKFTHLPVIYLEHGAGQSYHGDPQSRTSFSYSGGAGLDHVRLFLAPSDAVCARWSAAYPSAQVAAIGCPRLDEVGAQRARRGRRKRPVLVGMTFHWDCELVPETRSAFPHHRPAVAHVRDQADVAGMALVGHQHPRWHRDGPMRTYRELGVETTSEVDVLLLAVDVLIADNTSVIYEAAALDIPVVVLNAPWYRRDVHHGLRFWDQVPGPQVDDPRDVWDAVDTELLLNQWAPDRRRIASEVYAAPIGSATNRAVRAIEEAFDVEPL